MVTWWVVERRADAVIATGTPARAGVSLPAIVARALPVSFFGAVSSTAVVVTGPAGGGAVAEHEPTT